jgi:ATP-binding cassette subfamily B protein
VIVQSVLMLTPVLILRALIDRLTKPHPHFAGVLALLALGLAALLVAGLIGVASNYLATRISESIVYDLRQQLYEHLLGHPVAYFTRRRSGDLLSHLITDVAGIETVLTQSLLTLIGSGCLMVAMVALMFVLDWRLALLTLVVVPAVVLPLRYAGRVSYRAQRRVQEQYAEVIAYLQETLGISGVMLVKAFDRIRLEKQRFAALNDELRRRQIHAAMVARWVGMGLTTLQAAGPVVLLMIGGLLITHGSAGLGTVLAFSTVIVGQFGASIQNLGTAALATMRSLAMWERTFGVLDDVSELTERPGAIDTTDIAGALRLQHVTFTYPGGPRPAVDDISVALQPGQLVALVGRSGAGKTTLSALIARFIDPQAGAVTLDGLDLRELTLSSLQRAVGVVFQDPFLFHTSLRENLRYGRPDASDEEILAAARDAHLAELIAMLPDGLDTIVGERGHRLSGGEKQRVAIARVLLRIPGSCCSMRRLRTSTASPSG